MLDPQHVPTACALLAVVLLSGRLRTPALVVAMLGLLGLGLLEGSDALERLLRRTTARRRRRRPREEAFLAPAAAPEEAPAVVAAPEPPDPPPPRPSVVDGEYMAEHSTLQRPGFGRAVASPGQGGEGASPRRAPTCRSWTSSASRSNSGG